MTFLRNLVPRAPGVQFYWVFLSKHFILGQFYTLNNIQFYWENELKYLVNQKDFLSDIKPLHSHDSLTLLMRIKIFKTAYIVQLKNINTSIITTCLKMKSAIFITLNNTPFRPITSFGLVASFSWIVSQSSCVIY
jgi:hypothetical protein